MKDDFIESSRMKKEQDIKNLKKIKANINIEYKKYQGFHEIRAIFFNIQRRHEHKETEPYANKLQGQVYICRRFYDRHRSPKSYRHSACLYDTRSQHSRIPSVCFPYFLSAYIRLCHCFHSFFCFESLFIYVHPSTCNVYYICAKIEEI